MTQPKVSTSENKFTQTFQARHTHLIFYSEYGQSSSDNYESENTIYFPFVDHDSFLNHPWWKCKKNYVRPPHQFGESLQIRMCRGWRICSLRFHFVLKFQRNSIVNCLQKYFSSSSLILLTISHMKITTVSCAALNSRENTS